MIVTDFKAEHLTRLRLQPAQEYLYAMTTEATGEAVEAALHAGLGWAYTALDTDGTVLGCGGVLVQWQGRGLAWSYISCVGGAKFVAVHRAVKRFFDVCHLHRIEATVDEGFEEGHRWMAMLGFELETRDEYGGPKPMRGYRPDGGACYLYARVR